MLVLKKITIAVDAMGGDRGVDLVIPAAIRAVKKHPNLELILVGQQKVINEKLRRRKAHRHAQITVHHASEEVGMDESPAIALRTKKDSSMRVAINLVKEEQADACVSAGNTGALLATARFVLKTIPGVDRPAILGMIPARNKEGYIRLIDMGANIRCTEEHLFQFAAMGSVLAQAVDDMKKPRVALLNVGEEDIKGHEEIRAAAKLLEACEDINYTGFIEGNNLFTDSADIIVCDGFAGNIALKSIEGFAGFMKHMILQAMKRNIFNKLMAAAAAPIFVYIRSAVNPANYNGARFIGLRGTVIKSHGGTTVVGFVAAIERAMRDVRVDVPQLISAEVGKLLSQQQDTLL